jgi:hypothetical protein
LGAEGDRFGIDRHGGGIVAGPRNKEQGTWNKEQDTISLLFQVACSSDPFGRCAIIALRCG